MATPTCPPGYKLNVDNTDPANPKYTCTCACVDKAYLGFTASTGSLTAYQNLTSLKFSNRYQTIDYPKGGFVGHGSDFSTLGGAVVSPYPLLGWSLTQNQNNQFGSVWYGLPLRLADDALQVVDFSITFTTLLAHMDDVLPADGLCMVIQSMASSAGSAGGGLGYSGISQSMGVCLDIYHNDTDPLGSHIELNFDGNVALSHKTAIPPVVLTSSMNNITLMSRYSNNPYAYMQELPQLRHWVDYKAVTAGGPTLSIFVSTTDTKPANPLISQVIDLTPKLIWVKGSNCPDCSGKPPIDVTPTATTTTATTVTTPATATTATTATTVTTPATVTTTTTTTATTATTPTTVTTTTTTTATTPATATTPTPRPTTTTTTTTCPPTSKLTTTTTSTQAPTPYPTENPCEGIINPDNSKLIGTFVKLKVYDQEARYWLDVFCDNTWKVRNSDNTGWVDMHWYNTKMRSEDNKVWYDPYCTEDPCRNCGPTEAPITTSPSVTSTTTVTTAPSVTSTTAPTSTTATTTTSNVVSVQGLSYSALAKGTNLTILSAYLDLENLAGAVSDHPGKVVTVENLEGTYTFVVTIGFFNPTVATIFTALSVIVYCQGGTGGMLQQSFDELRYGDSRQFPVVYGAKAEWSGTGSFNLSASTGYKFTATISSLVAADLDVRLWVFRKSVFPHLT